MEDSEELEDRRADLEQLLYDLKINVDCLTGSKEEKPPLRMSGVTEISSIRLPRIKIPALDGKILNWRIFLKKFDSAIHSKPNLSDSDKLTYLREALKNGPAKNVVLGLTQTYKNFNEAMQYLNKRSDRPCVLHQVHFRKIQEAFPLKAGSGQELRPVHDLLSQHIRALTASEGYNIETYLTAAIELKLVEVTKLR